MSEMSPEARSILDAGRRAHDPTARDKSRVRTALRARIAAGDVPVTLRPTVPRWALGLAALAALGLLLVLATRRPRVEPTPPTGVPAPIAAPIAAPSAAPVAPSPAPVVAVAPPPPVVAAPTTHERPRPAPTDTLAEELRILREARGALAQGHPDAALRAAQTHARRFPSGQLVEEREALRVNALCVTSPVGAARRALDDFAQRFPRSPQLPRLRRACDTQGP